MLPRAIVRNTAVAIVLLMVFVQGAIASTMCGSQPHSAALAIAKGNVPPCHETTDERRNTNLCVAHCESQSQSLDKPSVSVPAMPVAPVFRLDVPHADMTATRVAFATRIIPPGAPPPLIRFSVILQ